MSLGGTSPAPGCWISGGRTEALDSRAFSSLRRPFHFKFPDADPIAEKMPNPSFCKFGFWPFHGERPSGGCFLCFDSNAFQGPQEVQAWAQGPSLDLETHTLWTLQTGSHPMCEATTPGHCPGATSSEVSAPRSMPLVPTLSDTASVVTNCTPIPGSVESLLRTN